MMIAAAAASAFAAVVLRDRAISFPLPDRHVGVTTAVTTSVRAVLDNPGPMAAGSGSSPAWAGIPLLSATPSSSRCGHATWHLYRKLVPRNSPKSDLVPFSS